MATKEAQKKWRDRVKLGLIQYCTCGRTLRDSSRALCFNCWLKTPEGKAYNQETVARCTLQKIDLVTEAKKIASQYPYELGFVNSAALEEALRKKTLDVIPSIGFVHWHHRRDGQTTIYSLAVTKDYHGQGYGRLLFYRVLCSLVEYRKRSLPLQNKFSIVAKCPQDLQSNHFYEHLGFKLDGTEPGRKRAFTRWRC